MSGIWILNRTNILLMSHLSHISAFMLGKTVINKRNTSKIFDMAEVDLRVQFVCKVHQLCGRHFKQNKDQVETLEEYFKSDPF
jgi:prephenate dehydrogenase